MSAFIEKWWISPNGHIIPLKGTAHINDIMEEPEKFGFSRDQLVAIHDKYGERLGSEGDARTEIMKMAMAKGWIRARYGQNNGFYLETSNLERAKKIMWDVVTDFQEKFHKQVWEPLMLMDYKTRNMIKSTLGEITKKLFASSSVSEGLFHFMGLARLLEDPKVPPGMMLLRHSFMVQSTGMSKIFRYVQEGVPFVMISAHRSENPRSENNARQRELYAILRERGYGPIPLHAGWWKNSDTPGGDRELIPEESFLVRGMSLEEALPLGQRFEQDSILAHDANRFGVWSTKSGDYGSQEVEFTREPNKMFDFHPDYVFSELYGRRTPYPKEEVETGEKTNPTKTKRWAFVPVKEEKKLSQGSIYQEETRKIVISSEYCHSMWSRMRQKYAGTDFPPVEELIITWKERLVPSGQ